MEIFQTRLDSPESRPFGLPGAELLSISRSGEMAVSLDRSASIPFTRSGTLARLSMTGGGSPREVLEDVQFADWSPDGQSLAVVRNLGGKVRLEFPAGKVLYETAGWISHPRVSPGGDEVAFLDHPVQGDDGGSAAMVDRSGRRRSLSEFFASAQGLCWSPDGKEVWFTVASVEYNRGLYAATPAGDVRVLVKGTGGLIVEDSSKDGQALMVQDKARLGISALARERRRSGTSAGWTGRSSGSLGGRADPAFWRERRRRRARLLRLRPQGRWLARRASGSRKRVPILFRRPLCGGNRGGCHGTAAPPVSDRRGRGSRRPSP